MMRYIFIIVFMIMAGPSHAADELFEKLVNAKSLKCEFGPGFATEWEDGKIKSEPAKFNATLHYDSIDLKKGTARLIGNQGSADITSFATLSGISFIETTTFGNINITTIYFEYSDKNSKQFKAVQSRHITIMGEALPSQYYGSCKIWE